MTQRFYFYSAPRTGSTEICNLFHQYFCRHHHNEYHTCLYEFFYVDSDLRTKTATGMMLDEPDLDRSLLQYPYQFGSRNDINADDFPHITFIKDPRTIACERMRRLDMLRRAQRFHLFKIFGNQWTSEIGSVLDSAGYRPVVLMRRDLVDQYASFAASLLTGRWHYKVDDSLDVATNAIDIPRYEVDDWFREFIIPFRNNMPKDPLAVIAYEDVRTDLIDCFRRLGFDRPRDVVHEHRPTPYDPKNLIRNVEDVRQWLFDLDREHP